MKKLFCLFSVVLMLFINSTYADAQNRRYHFKNVYTQVDTIAIENATVPTENGDYLIELPTKSSLVVAYDSQHSKCIILKSDYPFIKHMEYNVADTEKRLVLWFIDKGKHIYCGFTYDKKSKTAHYFEAINENEKNKLIKKMPFLKNMPTF